MLIYADGNDCWERVGFVADFGRGVISVLPLASTEDQSCCSGNGGRGLCRGKWLPVSCQTRTEYDRVGILTFLFLKRHELRLWFKIEIDFVNVIICRSIQKTIMDLLLRVRVRYQMGYFSHHILARNLLQIKAYQKNKKTKKL